MPPILIFQIQKGGHILSDTIFYDRSAYVMRNSAGVVMDVGKLLGVWLNDASGPHVYITVSSSDLH